MPPNLSCILFTLHSYSYINYIPSQRLIKLIWVSEKKFQVTSIGYKTFSPFL